MICVQRLLSNYINIFRKCSNYFGCYVMKCRRHQAKKLLTKYDQTAVLVAVCEDYSLIFSR